jgi:hypothetical protein
MRAHRSRLAPLEGLPAAAGGVTGGYVFRGGTGGVLDGGQASCGFAEGFGAWNCKATDGDARILPPSPSYSVRAKGAHHQWRKIPSGELSIAPVADERLWRVTGLVEAS